MLTERVGRLVIRFAEQRPELREGRVGKALDAGSTIPVPGGGGGEGDAVGVNLERLAGLESRSRKRRRDADNVFVTFTGRGNRIDHYGAGIMEPAVAEVPKVIERGAAAAESRNDPGQGEGIGVAGALSAGVEEGVDLSAKGVEAINPHDVSIRVGAFSVQFD